MKTDLMILRGISIIILLLMTITENVTGNKYSFEEEHKYCADIYRKIRKEEN